MKKWCIPAALVLLLTGCGAQTEPVYETVGQIEYEPVVEAEPQVISVWTPEDAAAQTLAGEESGTLYSWSDCELRVETMEAGDIQKTLETVTGLDFDNLTVMNYSRNGLEVYETVWSCGSEDGVYLGRAMVADDGEFHYCVSLMSPEQTDTDQVYAQICGSFSLSREGEGK